MVSMRGKEIDYFIEYMLNFVAGIEINPHRHLTSPHLMCSIHVFWQLKLLNSKQQQQKNNAGYK